MAKLVYVPQGCWAVITPNSDPDYQALGTDGLQTCSGVAVTAVRNGFCFLCHANSLTDLLDRQEGIPAWIEMIHQFDNGSVRGELEIKIRYDDQLDWYGKLINRFKKAYGDPTISAVNSDISADLSSKPNAAKNSSAEVLDDNQRGEFEFNYDDEFRWQGLVVTRLDGRIVPIDSIGKKIECEGMSFETVRTPVNKFAGRINTFLRQDYNRSNMLETDTLGALVMDDSLSKDPSASLLRPSLASP